MEPLRKLAKNIQVANWIAILILVGTTMLFLYWFYTTDAPILQL
ncbi:MAG: hypothetical protein ACW976_00710 [Candidatus Ranarchaeia archaeon]